MRNTRKIMVWLLALLVFGTVSGFAWTVYTRYFLPKTPLKAKQVYVSPAAWPDYGLVSPGRLPG